ncbi:MAG: hypothetical protein ACYC39_03085 [Thiobacillus sp.]
MDIEFGFSTLVSPRACGFTHSGDRAWLDLSFRMLHVGISRAAPKALPGMLRSALQTTQTVWQERQQIALAVERPRFSGW